MRLGIIGSSGGSALAASDRCILSIGQRIEWITIVDRPCGLRSWAKENGYQNHLIDYRDAIDFSRRALEIFNKCECTKVMLFYTRRVANPLIHALDVFNIHPSLLPSFRGLHGVRDAYQFGSRIFGATLHHVDEGIDTGPIIAQIAEPLPPSMTIVEAEHRSYLHKVWLMLVWFDYLTFSSLLTAQEIVGDGRTVASPGLRTERLRDAYTAFLQADDEEVSGRRV